MPYQVTCTITGTDYAVRLEGQLNGQAITYTLAPREKARLTFDAVPMWEKGRYGFEYRCTCLDADGHPLVSFLQTIIVPPDVIASAHTAPDSSGVGWLYTS